MDFCVSITKPGVFFTVLMLERLSIIRNKSIEELRNELCLSCYHCGHPAEFRNRDDLIPKELDRDRILGFTKGLKPFYEDIFNMETQEVMERQYYIAHSRLPKSLSIEEKIEELQCVLRVGSKDKFFKTFYRHVDSEEFDNIQTIENIGKGLICYIYSSLNKEYNINCNDYFSNNNKDVFIELPTFNKHSDVSSSVKFSLIKIEKIKVFIRYFLSTYKSSNNFIDIYADILLNDYFKFNTLSRSKLSKIKEKLVMHCYKCLCFSFLKLKEDKLNELLFMSTWFYGNTNKKVRLEELSYFINFFKDRSSNSFYFMKKIYSCTDHSSLYLPIKKLRDSRFYLDTKEKSRLKGIYITPPDESYLSLPYSDQQDFNFYFIAGYFLIKLISLPYLQSIKTQQKSPEAD